MSDADECFTVIWVIENFSLFLTTERRLRSPVVETNRKSWEIIAYHLSRSFVHFQPIRYWLAIDKCEMSVTSSFGEVKMKQLHGTFVIERNALCGNNRQSILPNDTLTVCCRIGKETVRNREYRICSVLRRVNFPWNIEKIDSSESHSNTFMDKDWIFRMRLSRNKEKMQEIYTVRVWQENKGHHFLECKMSIKPNYHERVSHSIPFVCGEFISTWEKDIKVFNASSSLQLELEFIVAANKGQTSFPLPSTTKSVKDTVESVAVLDSTGTLRDDLLHIYRERALSDATLNTEGESFPAHRIILAARSSVFRAMFEKDQLSEGRDGVVDIEDIDSETVQRLLVFLYGDSLEGVQWEEASKLYYAAYKYAVHNLKQKCVDILKTGLAVHNVCDALALADRHSDQELMRHAVDFIRDHEEVVSSTEWERLEDSNSRLTSKIVRELFIKKGKK